MEWQPIETAPRDGSQLLLMTTRGHSIGAWNSRPRGPGISGGIQSPGWVAYTDGYEIDDAGWDTGTDYVKSIDPTHWMPLPPPPRSEQ